LCAPGLTTGANLLVMMIHISPGRWPTARAVSAAMSRQLQLQHHRVRGLWGPPELHALLKYTGLRCCLRC